MTREEAKQLKLDDPRVAKWGKEILAYIDGATVEYASLKIGDWRLATDPNFDWGSEGCIYRIATPKQPESKQPEKKQYITNPLTKRVALEITRDMWNDIADNRYKTKEDALRKLGLQNKLYLACACCEYTAQQGYEKITRCKLCPLASLWPGHIGCENTNSPYRAWKIAGDPIYARQIADAAQAELDKLDKEEQIKSDPYAVLKKARNEGKTIQFIGKKPHHLPSIWTLYPKEGNFNETTFIYRIKPEPRYRAWKAEEVPVGALLRHKTERFGFAPITMILCVRGAWVVYVDAVTAKLENRLAQNIFFADYEHSLDNGKTWQPCGVLVEE